MYIVKVLKRKDAASVVVAVVLAFVFTTWAPMMLGELSGFLAGVSDGQYFSYNIAGADWKVAYLQPTILALLQILLLEVVIRLIVWLRPMVVRRAK